MPPTKVVFFQDRDGTVPVRDWLQELRARRPRAMAKCVVRIQRLAELGHELRRPEADFVRDGIHELRAREGTVNYRILYFFYGKNEVVLAHSLTKEGKLPEIDIERALRRKTAFESRPAAHTHEGDVRDG